MTAIAALVTHDKKIYVVRRDLDRSYLRFNALRLAGMTCMHLHGCSA